MRICIVMEYHPDDLVGGAEVQVLGLARHFARLGNDVAYVCQRYDGSRPVDETADGVRVLRILRWHRVFRALAAPQLFWTIRRLRPEVVYQRFASPYTGLAALSARILKVPFVWGCAEDVSVEGRVFLRRSLTETRRGPLGWVKRVVLRGNAFLNQALFDRGLRAARAIIVQNGRQAELLRQNYRRGATVIPNGVELTQKSGERSATPLVLWLNTVMRRKRAEVFIELARALAGEHPDTEFALVGGRSDDAYMRDLREQAAGVPGLVFYGAVPYAETASWFRRAWVYVLTSNSEGFPNVMLQAWAAGTPVVSLSIDPDGLMAKGGLGLLSGTEEGLQKDMSRLLGDAGLRERLAGAARSYVAGHLDLGMIAERYLELFRELDERPSG